MAFAGDRDEIFEEAQLHVASGLTVRRDAWQALTAPPLHPLAPGDHVIPPLIAIAQLRLRSRFEAEAPDRLQIKMWLHPYGTWATIAAMGGILVLMAFSKSMVELWASVIVTSAFAIAYVMRRRPGPKPLPQNAA